MQASDPRELLLCALRHFNLQAEQRAPDKFQVHSRYTIRITPEGDFQLLEGLKVVGTFNNVVLLCAKLQQTLSP